MVLIFLGVGFIFSISSPITSSFTVGYSLGSGALGWDYCMVINLEYVLSFYFNSISPSDKLWHSSDSLSEAGL